VLILNYVDCGRNCACPVQMLSENLPEEVQKHLCHLHNVADICFNVRPSWNEAESSVKCFE
jgi:hypothetical protein